MPDIALEALHAAQCLLSICHGKPVGLQVLNDRSGLKEGLDIETEWGLQQQQQQDIPALVDDFTVRQKVGVWGAQSCSRHPKAAHEGKWKPRLLNQLGTETVMAARALQCKHRFFLCEINIALLAGEGA